VQVGTKDYEQAVWMSFRRVAIRAVLFAAAVLAPMLASLPAFAAEHHGQVLFGGVPVPGAVVTATQGTATKTAVTNDIGIYSFPDLADGAWTLQIQMTGFDPVKQQVTVGPNAEAEKIELKPMSLAEVRAALKPAKVDPAAAMSGAAPGAVAAAETPEKEGAKAAKAGLEAAGAAPPPSPPPDAQAQQANDGFLVNGSVNNAATSQYAQSAAIGNARGNGRSLYNWGLSAILDNSSLDAKPYSLTSTDSPKPSYTNLQLGANFGGPIHFKSFIPLAKAPYLYLFYQRNRNTDSSTVPALLPTLAQRNGDLSAAAGPIYAPTSGLSTACLSAGVVPGQPFTGNKVPGACISPAAVRLLSLYPSPNLTSPDPRFNFQTALANQTHIDAMRMQISPRNFGNKNSVYGTFAWRSTRSSTNSLFGFHDTSTVHDIQTTAQWTRRFTQRVLLSSNYTFTRTHSQGVPFFANRQDIESEAGIGGVLTDPAYWGPPSLSFSSGFSGLSDGLSSNNRIQTNALSEQLTWNRGRHEMALGGELRRQEFNYFTQQNPRGSFQFTGTATRNPQTGAVGSDIADLLLGIPDTSSIAYGNPDKYLRQSAYALYFRDNFRVTPELTINAGLRWEYGSPINEVKNRLVNLDFAPGFTASAPVVATNPVGPLSGMHYPHALVLSDYSGILPNISVAWRPISGSSLLVRSSYQWYNDTSVYQATALAMAQQAPLSTSLSLDNTRCGLTLADAFSACPSVTPDGFSVDPNLRVGYAQIWQLSMQRDLPAALQATITYRGTKGTRGVQEILPNTYPYGGVNPCPSCPLGFSYRTSNGNSTREEGILQVRRRLRNGLTAEALYTFSKSLDDDYQLGGQGAVPGAAGNGGGGASSAAPSQIAQDWRNPAGQRGLSSFDQRHVLSASAQYTTGMGLGGHTLLSGWRGVLYKDWTALTTITFATGTPLSPIYAVQVPGTSYAGTIRPNYNPGQPIHLSSSLANNQKVYLNAGAYSVPDGGWGNARRNSIEGPTQFALNASMARTFKLHDRYSLETHFDATNVLNHVSYTNWYTTLSPTGSNPLFGTPTSTQTMRQIKATFRLRY